MFCFGKVHSGKPCLQFMPLHKQIWNQEAHVSFSLQHVRFLPHMTDCQTQGLTTSHKPVNFCTRHYLLVHLPYQPVDLVFPVACISTLYKVCGFLLHSTSGRGQFEGPEEIVCCLEVFANSVDLMDQIFNTNDVTFPCWNKIYG